MPSVLVRHLPTMSPLTLLTCLFAMLFVSFVDADMTTGARHHLHRYSRRHRHLFKRSPDMAPLEGATLKNITLSRGRLTSWFSNGPIPANVESVVFASHGVDGNGRDYYKWIDAAYWAAKNENLTRTHVKTLRIAPYFFDVDDDTVNIDNETLGWTEDRWWCEGRRSTHPSGSNMTPFDIWDELVKMFSDQSAYPRVKYITFVGHGCGGIVTNGYAVVGSPPTRSDIKIRYVVGNPSTEVYFTKDRPLPVDPLQCPSWNEWPVSLERFDTGDPQPGPAATVFQRYIARDVRYLVSLDDLGGGDQSCEAKLLGGVARKDRTLAYWKYVHLLAGDGDAASFNAFPGNFSEINREENKVFRGGKVTHKLFQFSGINHDPGAILNSHRGRIAIWGA